MTLKRIYVEGTTKRGRHKGVAFVAELHAGDFAYAVYDRAGGRNATRSLLVSPAPTTLEEVVAHFDAGRHVRMRNLTSGTLNTYSRPHKLSREDF